MPNASPTLAELFAIRSASDGERAIRATPDGEALEVELAKIATGVTGFAAPPAAGVDMVEHLESVLKPTVASVLTNAWNKRAEILKYGDVSKYPIGNKPSYVSLAPHDVKWFAEPNVRIIVNETIDKTVKFLIEGKFHIDGAELTIRDTRIMSMRTGKSWFEGKISYGKLDLIKRKGGEYVFPGELTFGEGIQIPPPKVKQVV